MANEILPYIEMRRREGVSLQRGMNFELGGNHSVILMSVRPGAPYADRLESLQPHHPVVQGRGLQHVRQHPVVVREAQLGKARPN